MAATALALAPFAAAAAAAPAVAPTMTLVEAKQLSPQALAEKLLGAAGANGGYVEAKIEGNGGLMIRAPGLNSVTLYKRPTSAGFDGLCEVQAVVISFSASRHSSSDDPPHHVTDFWKKTHFAMLAPTAKRVADGGGEEQERDCERLAPVVDRADPAFFTTNADKAVDAYFAMRVLAKAQTVAPVLGAMLTCKASNSDPVCLDPVAGLRAIPLQRITHIDIARCADGPNWCVAATWVRSFEQGEAREVQLHLQTDIATIDPSQDFAVVAVHIDAGTVIYD